MICCGQDRRSKFCPECGGRVTAGPRERLIRKIKSAIAVYQSFIERCERQERPSNSKKREAKMAALKDELNWLENQP